MSAPSRIRKRFLSAVAAKRLAIMALALSTFTLPAHARLPTAFDTRPPGEQVRYFTAVLHELGARPVTQLEHLARDPQSKVLIVLGPDRSLENLGLNRLIAQGLSVLIASDQRFSDRLYEELGIRVTGEFRKGFREDCYRGEFEDCPLLHAFQFPGFNASRHPIAQLLSPDVQIASNRPSYLTWDNGPFNPIATIRTPGRSFNLSVGNRKGIEFPFPDQVLVGVAREYPDTRGRLLVLADHSLFIDMMMQPDNHNLDFTFGVIRWLMEDGKRTEVLLMDNGAIQRSFNVSLARLPMPPVPSLESLLPLVSRRIAELERENVFNKMIQRSIEHSTLMRGAAILFTLGLLGFGVFRFLNTRHRFDARPRLAADAVALWEHRRRPDIEVGNFAEAARELALGAFQELGRPVVPSSPAPACTIQGSWRERWSWRRRIGRLWSIAAGNSESVSASRLRGLHAELLELRAATSAGVVQFAPVS
jgi:hypothetical protein